MARLKRKNRQKLKVKREQILIVQRRKNQFVRTLTAGAVAANIFFAPMAVSANTVSVQKSIQEYIQASTPEKVQVDYRSKDLYNPDRQYFDTSDIKEIKNMGSFDFIRMKDLPGIEYNDDLSRIKYIVIHETDNFDSSSRAVNNYNYFKSPKAKGASSAFIVDDETIVQTMSLNGIDKAMGDSANDIKNGSVLSIEMCTNTGSDYRKTVATTILLARALADALPNAQIMYKRHYDAYSETEWGTGNKVPKQCPRIVIEETGGWTWDEMLRYLNNKDLEIPYLNGSDTYIDVHLIPFINDEGEEDWKYDYTELKNKDGSLVTDLAVKDVESKDAKLAEKIFDLNPEEDIKGESESIVNYLFNNISKQDEKDKSSLDNKNNNDDIIINKYEPLDIDKNVEFIFKNSPGVAFGEYQTKEILKKIDTACRLENVNPKVAVQLMNGYTGYLSYKGSVGSETYNFAGLKDKEGNYINYGCVEYGAIALVQYIKSLSSKERLLLDGNSDALKTISKRGTVKKFSDLTEALNVEEGFINSVADRIKKL